MKEKSISKVVDTESTEDYKRVVYKRSLANREKER